MSSSFYAVQTQPLAFVRPITRLVITQCLFLQRPELLNYDIALIKMKEVNFLFTSIWLSETCQHYMHVENTSQYCPLDTSTVKLVFQLVFST